MWVVKDWKGYMTFDMVLKHKAISFVDQKTFTQVSLAWLLGHLKSIRQIKSGCGYWASRDKKKTKFIRSQ